ncbi:ornithine cyclodeaminase [Palleronia marisminoris]|uniref:Ornithine cyclodeaminase n=1 Tax=Palleronia marisminoris TaxID=315423 RepID=A0A1Y5RVM5_9RHOB|nr:ornithine cyclodeaminase [Palleronia marisminoris]SFG48501.1 ornithine cyclodeaminase [Palleronia marisminoris]SLN25247.1 ornithine cyclodeaminase [Palleronia marisminoris]
MDARIITYDATRPRLSWTDTMEAIRAGHTRPRAQIGDLFLGPSDGTLLTRGAYVEGLGYGVKSVTVFSGNADRGLPTVQGAMFVFSPEDGHLEAIVDSRLVTEFKTAGDSILGARLLACPDPVELLIVGGGTVARSLILAYGAAFPSLERISIWSRRPEQAEALADEFPSHSASVAAVDDLARAAGHADIVSTATMAREPVLRGKWIAPGTHVDLIGAFKPDMREADDALISGGSLFVDSRETTIGHIGELSIPIAAGVITPEDVRGDFHDLVSGGAGRRSDDEITVFKNGGGAHLDLMVARYIASVA